MTKLDRFISELCPDGVEYKPLNQVAQYSSTRISAKEVGAKNYVGVDNLLSDKGGKGLSGYVPESGMLTRFEPNDILIGNIRPYLKKIWLSDCVGGTNGDVLVVHITVDNLSAEYLYYVLSSDSFFTYATQHSKGGKMPRGSKDANMRYAIPIPPFPIQNEIVRILDNFTELTAELAAELTARHKQYEYYRDELLTFGDDVPMVSIGEVCVTGAGGTPSRNNPEYWESGTIKWLGSTVCKNQKYIDEVTEYITDIGMNNSSAKMLKHGTTLIAMVGATIGKTAFLNFEATTNQNVAALYPLDENCLDESYLFYMCQTLFPHFSALSSGGKLPIANISFIRGLRIPLPPIDEQKRIATILDRFDALTTDISSGLPAEIAARQKQYEYYRDKLLTFPVKQNVC